MERLTRQRRHGADEQSAGFASIATSVCRGGRCTGPWESDLGHITKKSWSIAAEGEKECEQIDEPGSGGVGMDEIDNKRDL